MFNKHLKRRKGFPVWKRSDHFLSKWRIKRDKEESFVQYKMELFWTDKNYKQSFTSCLRLVVALWSCSPSSCRIKEPEGKSAKANLQWRKTLWRHLGVMRNRMLFRQVEICSYISTMAQKMTHWKISYNL